VSSIPSPPRLPRSFSKTEQDKVNRAQATVRSHVVNELLQTEMSYVKSLQVLREGFINPIRKAKVISDDQLKTIVANIEQLHELHVKFSESVQKRVSEWNENSIVSDIFLEQVRLFVWV
jgi:predicted nucleic acid-binding protein